MERYGFHHPHRNLASKTDMKKHLLVVSLEPVKRIMRNEQMDSWIPVFTPKINLPVAKSKVLKH